MSVIKGCIVAAVALAAGAMAEFARADEAYVCDAGRIVYVKPGELEMKKLQDPCIAKYFETTSTANAAASKPLTDAASRVPQSTTSAPIAPIRKADSKSHVEPSGSDRSLGDYRDVRIINAAPGADAWFRHRH